MGQIQEQSQRTENSPMSKRGALKDFQKDSSLPRRRTIRERAGAWEERRRIPSDPKKGLERTLEGIHQGAEEVPHPIRQELRGLQKKGKKIER